MLSCPDKLAPLLRSVPGVAAVCTERDRPAYDAYVPLLSLPRLFGTTPQTIPGTRALHCGTDREARRRARRAGSRVVRAAGRPVLGRQ